MEHGTPDAQIVTLPLEVMGNEWEVRTGRSSLNLPHATRHLVMEASSQLPPEDEQALRYQKMAPPQASP